MLDLFESAREESSEPLAARMRPRNLSEYIGQEHILGKGRLLRRAIQLDQLSSVIFYGPPGTGKTTLARVIANTTKSHFSTMNAVLAGLKDLDAEINAAKERKDLDGIKTILFIDEVHRWNKRQQDALLPWVENGTVILIGATTENPYFEVNAALVSRSRIFQLKKLTDENLMQVASQAISDKERGYGNWNVKFEDGALEHLVKVAAGDARSLLNALQLAIETTPDKFPPAYGDEIYITKEIAEESIQQKAVLYDKEGDYHFDVISAFIKSLRGSDPDASLYWLARMVQAGEDPKFIFRRMLISAAEDVGLADPNAIRVVESCASAFDRIGLPEGRFHLAEAALYLSTCPKSNSTIAFFDALSDVEQEKDSEVPNHLKDPGRDKEGFGHGEGYLYPHSYRDHWVSQQYLPTGLQGKIYYRPTRMGYEDSIRDEVLRKREAQLEAVVTDEWEENLTYSPGDRKRNMWLERAAGTRSTTLLELSARLYDGLKIRRHDNVLTMNASHGLLLWPLMKMNPEGYSVAQCEKKEQKEVIDHFSEELDELTRPLVLVSSPLELFSIIEDDLYFRVISGRNVLTHFKKSGKIMDNMKKHLEKDGAILLIEAIPSLSSRLSDFANSEELKDALLSAEKEIYGKKNEMASWGRKELEKLISSNFENHEISYIEKAEDRMMREEMLDAWWRNSYGKHMDESMRDSFMKELKDRKVSFKSTYAIVRAGDGKLLSMHENPTKEEWEDVHEKTR